MADHASTQLPSMVRKPKAVWPGLDKMGMYQKQIAGDGNCLFASLSDQLYGTPANHPEIRASVVDHMRTYRPLFEHYVHKDDVQQRRTLRSATLASRQEPEDAFEEYLSLMSRSGTYGGEPELVAFCQVFDQDVTVHLPRIKNFDRDSILYTNEHRGDPATVLPLHICYGGDEVTRAHYDSARSRDGSTPGHKNSPLLRPQDAARNGLVGSPSSPHLLLSTRAIRSSKSELSSEFIQDFLEKSKRDMENNLDQLSDKYRARSPSVTSSQRSSSSKRSLDEDGEPVRASKRTDRRKSTRRRADMAIAICEPDHEPSPPMPNDSPSAASPPSTQDTDLSSDTPAQENTHPKINAHRLVPDEKGTSLETVADLTKPSPKTQPRISVSLVTNTAAGASESTSSRLMSVAERPKPTLRA
ncbi:uncharacterized protein Z520_00485 [Fonsecaea multimorphosa CBS 102226]|uniref:OTU domain-containing protein n=1 Tax=Fonsecaea multimorphosa CBS 102226 TaxID=1442371 RepID=A0A0D2L3Z5_9EURO|nr:uncharacterized protein Z520_00485 [Fonsecaea multimorphosa CBS 102226]KIY03794.1 hypothetical protein Z520_00485 [Fonsecaea multimorphosa CBS 102226]OAL32486.1 hypothetical protein AYO22_00508 [Fonsecaea multimorphosa]